MNQEYLTVFLDEAHEHLQSLNENVLTLEKNPTDLKVVGEIFRSAHTFKGMSATMDFESIADLTHEMENLLDDIRNEKLSVTEEKIDVILECIEKLENMVADIRNGGNGTMDVSETVTKLRTCREVDSVQPVSAKTRQGDSFFCEDTRGTHTINISLQSDCLLKAVRAVMVVNALNEIGKVVETNPTLEAMETEDFGFHFEVLLDTLETENEIEETALSVSEVEKAVVVPSVKKGNSIPSTSNPLVDNKEEKHKSASVGKKIENKTIRVNLEKIESLMNMFEETVIERGRIEELVYSLDHPELHERVQRLDSVSKELQNLVLSMRMVPVETVFNRFPRMVRQLSKDLNKGIDLIISGEDTEIDRMVIDEIGDPLVHLIRNSVDHGIESKEERLASGKSERGTVHLRAYHRGNSIVIEINDDGKGINKNKVLEKALSRNIITEAEGARLSPNEVAELIFEAGFSTADTISEVSGRGVGLDVVKTTINKLGGSVTVQTEENKGSTFRIELPLTLSIIQSMLVASDGKRYAIPLGNIIETMRISVTKVQNIQGRDVVNYRKKTIPIIELPNLFGESPNLTRDEREFLQVVIIKTNETIYAMSVDEIYGQREIVLKSLGDFFKEGAEYFSGATILGDGRVVLILDCDKTKY